MTVCPKHRDANGIRWRTGRVMCCVPTEVAGHQSASIQGDRGIDCKQACFIFQETGILVPAESRKWKTGSPSNQVTQYLNNPNEAWGGSGERS